MAIVKRENRDESTSRSPERRPHDKSGVAKYEDARMDRGDGSLPRDSRRADEHRLGKYEDARMSHREESSRSPEYADRKSDRSADRHADRHPSASGSQVVVVKQEAEAMNWHQEASVAQRTPSTVSADAHGHPADAHHHERDAYSHSAGAYAHEPDAYGAYDHAAVTRVKSEATTVGYHGGAPSTVDYNHAPASLHEMKVIPMEVVDGSGRGGSGNSGSGNSVDRRERLPDQRESEDENDRKSSRKKCASLVFSRRQ